MKPTDTSMEQPAQLLMRSGKKSAPTNQVGPHGRKPSEMQFLEIIIPGKEEIHVLVQDLLLCLGWDVHMVA